MEPSTKMIKTKNIYIEKKQRNEIIPNGLTVSSSDTKSLTLPALLN